MNLFKFNKKDKLIIFI